MKPYVSVCLSIYKTNPAYLREAIQSILNQTYKNFEFLIIDDCPEDNREYIVKSFKDSRIKYIKNKKNLGITLSRNKLIKLARGKYLAVMDHDDVSLSKRFEKQVKYLDEHPEVGVVGCWHTYMLGKQKRCFPTEDLEIKKGIVKGFCYLLHPASMIRKSVLTQNKIEYEKSYSPCEDFMLWARLIQYTQFHNIPEFLFKYRNHSDNTTSKNTQKMISLNQVIVAWMREKYPELNLKETFYYPCKLLPFIKVKILENKKNIYLFGLIPIISIKQKQGKELLIKILQIPFYKRKG